MVDIEYIEKHLMDILIVFLDDYSKKLLNIQKLPLVLTTQDLKKEFQISDSTLNRLIKLTDFPSCWYGVRGHYSRDEIIHWYKKNECEDLQEKKRILRSM